MSKKIVTKIIAELGAENIRSALGVSKHSVRHARADGAFPASWYNVLNGMCESAGIECPLSAFNMKQPAKNVGKPSTDCKGAA